MPMFSGMKKRTTAEYIHSGFERIDYDLNYLMECLREVLEELGEHEAARGLPWLPARRGRAGKARPVEIQSIEQAYSIAFQLLNMVEENAAALTRQQREIDHGIADEPGLWGEQLAALKRDGFTAGQIASFLPEVRIEPVLTAHPTEAKRSAVLEQHRAIYAIFSRLESGGITPSEQEVARDELKTILERLWRSGEILLQKPEVSTERRGVLFYLREVFRRPCAASTPVSGRRGRRQASTPPSWTIPITGPGSASVPGWGEIATGTRWSLPR